MGNTSTEPKTFQYAHSDLSLRNTLSHPTLSKARFIESNQGSNLELSFPIANETTLKRWREDIEEHRVKFQNNDAVFVPESLNYNKDSICGSTGVIQVQYKEFALVLDDEIENRIRIMQPFSEEEIWYLFYILVNVASELHNKGLTIGDVRPKNILMGIDGEVSFICKASFLDEQTNYAKSLETKEKTFLSPEQAQAIQSRKIECENETESECFSIGMTMMSIMLLHNEEILYFNDSVQERNNENYVFHYEKFERELYELSNCEIYSKFMREIVLALLETDAKQRMKMSEVYEILRQHESSIINFDEFKPNYKSLKIKSIPVTSMKSFKPTPHKNHSSRPSKHEQKISNHLSPYTESFSKHPNSNYENSVKSSNVTPHHETSKNNMINKTLEEEVEQKSYYDTHKEANNHYELANESIEEIRNQNKIARSMDLTVKSYATPIQNLNDFSQREENFSEKNKNNGVIQSDSPYRSKVEEVKQNLYRTGEVSGKKFSREMSFGNGSLAIEKNEQAGFRKLDDTARQVNSIKDSSRHERKLNDYSNFLTGVDELLENSRKMFPKEN